MENRKKGNKLKYKIAVLLALVLTICIGNIGIIAEEPNHIDHLGKKTDTSKYFLKDDGTFSLWDGVLNVDNMSEWHTAMQESDYSFNCINENNSKMYTGAYSNFTGWIESSDQILGYIRSEATTKDNMYSKNAFTGQSQQEGLWYYIGINNNQLEGISGNEYTLSGKTEKGSVGESVYNAGKNYSDTLDEFKKIDNLNFTATREGKNVKVTVPRYFAKLEVKCNDEERTIVENNNKNLILNLKDYGTKEIVFTLNDEYEEVNINVKAYAIEFTTYMRGMKPDNR